MVVTILKLKGLLGLLLFIVLCMIWIFFSTQTWVAESKTPLEEEKYEPSLEVTVSRSDHDLNIGADKNDLRSSYLMQYQPHHFVIRDGFTLPFSDFMLPIQFLMRQKWMKDLRDYLYEINPNGMQLFHQYSII